MRTYLTRERAATYDPSGAVDYLNLLENAMDAFNTFTIAAGARLTDNLVDLTARAGYALIDQKPKTPQEMASEYYVFDYTFAQTPEQSSFLASSWVRLEYNPVMTLSYWRLISYPVTRPGTSRTTSIRAASQRKTCSRLINAGSSISFKPRQQSSSSPHRSASRPLSRQLSIPTRRSRSHSRTGQR
jgi:hypothetical protein